LRIERTGGIEKLTPRVCKFLVEALGGRSLDEIQSAERSRIDYDCLRGLLSIELKTLEGDPAERTNNFVDTLRERADFPTFLGSVPIEAALKHMNEPDKLRRAALDRLGRTIVTHLKKANDQLRHHQQDFPRANRFRLVILINEDHPEYDPDTVAWIVRREFARTDESGSRYSHIDALLYFTERHAQASDGLVILPLVAVQGPEVHVNPWKSQLLDHVMEAWSGWNGVSLQHHEAGSAAFETIEHIPDSAPLHERWRLDYRRNPYFRKLSDDQLRDEFDEVVLVTLFWGLKNSPIKLTKNEAITGMERFTHIQVEMHYRALPMEFFQHEFSRDLAAAARLRLPDHVINWLHELNGSRVGSRWSKIGRRS
jgi:hypothetical protein